MEHFINQLAKRYPRLAKAQFTRCEKDVYRTEHTPAGDVEVLYFHNREDFEAAVIALAYRNEKRELPGSMGALFLKGLIDCTSFQKNCIILLSRGYYSAISEKMIYDNAGISLSREDWIEKSFVIRKNHELAHFIQREMFPANKDALKDEIKADMVGLVSAFGMYIPEMAKAFLGTEGDTYRPGGRLENYLSEDGNIDDLCKKANAYIEHIAGFISNEPAFDLLIKIEEYESKNKQ